jgi:O-antigen/teichoic acid export membrane protein
LSYKNSILLAHQKAYYRVAWEHSIHLVQIIGQIIVLVLTQNFILYLVLQMLNQVTVNVIVARKVDKEYPYLKEQKALPDRETCREISKNILAMSMHRLGGVVVNGTDNLMMSAFVGLASAGIYSNYQLVLTNINNVLGKIYNGFSSSIGNLAATEGSEKIYGIYKNLNFLMFALYGYLSVGLFVLLNPFIEMIFGKEYLFSMVMVLVMVLNFYIAGMRQITLQFRSAMGLFWRDRFKPVAEAVINLVVSILLVQKYGVIGILVGTIVSSLTTCCWVEPYIFIRYGIQKGWQEKLRSYFIEYLLRFLLVASAAGISYVLCGKLPGGGILWFVLKGMICTGIYGLFLLLTYGRSEEFGYFMEKGLEFLKKCRKKKEEK